MLRRVALLLASSFLLIVPEVASAQLAGGGSGSSSPDGGRPQSTRAGFLELLKSGGQFGVDQLQRLGPGGAEQGRDWDGVRSPQETIMTFEQAMHAVAIGQESEWPRALQAFGPDTENTEQTRRQALALQDVFDRLPDLSASVLPGQETVREQQMTRWELFPRGIDSEWAYTALGGSPDGAIVLETVPADASLKAAAPSGDDREQGRERENAEAGQPQKAAKTLRWRFTKQTVEDAVGLAESMRAIPPRPRLETDGGLFRETVGPTFTKTPWWAWPTLAGVLAATVAVMWLIGQGVAKVGQMLSDAGDKVLAPLLHGISIPLQVIVMAFGFLLGTAAIHFEPTLSEYRWNLAKVLVLVAGIWVLVAAIEASVLLLRRVFVSDDNPYAAMATTIFRRLLRIAAIVLLGLYVLRNVLEWNVTAVLGGVGLLGLALSLAAKDAVANLFGAFMIFASRPFLVGDWIVFRDQIGEVQDVSVQVTKMRLLGGELLSIPNQQFVDNPVENLSMREWKRRVFEVGITYDTPPEQVDRAIEILDEILRSDAVVGQRQGDLDRFPPKVSFTGFGPDYLNIRADYWYLFDPETDSTRVQRDTDRGYLTYLQHRGVVNRLVYERFGEAGIDFAFPTRTLKLEAGEVPVALTADGQDESP